MGHPDSSVRVVQSTARDVTQLLQAWSDGDQTALDRLVPLVEAELRRLARASMGRERKDHTLQPTALVNEAFLRFAGARHVRWQDRAHFMGIASRLMRRVLVDHARARGYQKRGGGAERVSLDGLPLETRRTGARRHRTRSSARGFCECRREAQPGRRAAVLRRADPRRDGRGPPRIRGNHQARLAACEALAASRAERRRSRRAARERRP